MKTSEKYFGLVVGPKARQHESKWPKNDFLLHQFISHKKTTPPAKNFVSSV